MNVRTASMSILCGMMMIPLSAQTRQIPLLNKSLLDEIVSRGSLQADWYGKLGGSAPFGIRLSRTQGPDVALHPNSRIRVRFYDAEGTYLSSIEATSVRRGNIVNNPMEWTPIEKGATFDFPLRLLSSEVTDLDRARSVEVEYRYELNVLDYDLSRSNAEKRIGRLDLRKYIHSSWPIESFHVKLVLPSPARNTFPTSPASAFLGKHSVDCIRHSCAHRHRCHLQLCSLN